MYSEMYLAKPNLNNFLHAEKFATIKEAVKFLNDRLKVEEKVDENGDAVAPAMIFPKMGFADFALLGKILRVEADGYAVFTEEEKELEAMEDLEGVAIAVAFLKETEA